MSLTFLKMAAFVSITFLRFAPRSVISLRFSIIYEIASHPKTSYIFCFRNLAENLRLQSLESLFIFLNSHSLRNVQAKFFLHDVQLLKHCTYFFLHDTIVVKMV